MQIKLLIDSDLCYNTSMTDRDALTSFAITYLGYKLDEQGRIYKIMGQYAPNAGERVFISLEEVNEKYADSFRQMAKYGCG
jgi:hypothetical protein